MAGKSSNGRKRNGIGKGNHPNSLANLKPCKPGERPPSTPRKPRTFIEKFRAHFSEMVTRPDGRVIPRDDAIIEILAKRALHSLEPLVDGEGAITGVPEWDKAIDHVLNRLSPLQRQLESETERKVGVQVNDNGVTMAFVERVRTFSGSEDVCPSDVMDYLDQDLEKL